MKKILVTGASGQLGQCFNRLSQQYKNFDLTFASSEDLDLSLFGAVNAYFRREKFDYCINCAAYTNVERAETEQEMAYLVNAESVKNLAEVCCENKTVLVHFSTDYVFDGKKGAPYTEEDETAPINVYGASKLLGEGYIGRAMERYFIVRTSWLYSDIGHNFYNTIRKKAGQGEELRITSAQTGTPTNAYDLGRFVLQLIDQSSEYYGIYHYSNKGEASWFDFAAEIVKNQDSESSLLESNDFTTLAARPTYSVLCKRKAEEIFGITIPDWRNSLQGLMT